MEAAHLDRPHSLSLLAAKAFAEDGDIHFPASVFLPEIKPLDVFTSYFCSKSYGISAHQTLKYPAAVCRHRTVTASTTGTGSKDNTESTAGNMTANSTYSHLSNTPSWLTLQEDETVIWSGKPRTLPLAPRLSIPVFISIILLWLILTSALTGGLLWLGVAGFVGFLLEAFWVWLNYTSTQYVITNTGLYERQGIFSRTLTHVRMNRIQNTQFQQSVFGRLFGYGKLSIDTAGTPRQELKFKCIPSSDGITELISRQLTED